MLSGIGIAVQKYVLVVYINETAPKELKATGQTLALIAIAGLPYTIGNIVGGVLSDVLGTVRLLQMCGVYVTIVCGFREDEIGI